MVEDMTDLEELCSVSEAHTKALSKHYALKAVKANPFYSTVEHRKVIFTRIAALKTNESRIAAQRAAEQVVNDLCEVVGKALTLICDYRAKRNEMLQEIDPDFLLSEELKAESSFETKLFANAEKGEYDHKLTD